MSIEEATGTSYKDYQFIQFQGKSVPDKINNIQCKALIRQASNRTYRLIDKTDQSYGGTAIAINIGDRYFMATAGHVISKNHKYKIVLRNKTYQSLDSFLSYKIDAIADVGLLEIPKEKKQLIDSWVNISDICTDFDRHKENDIIIVGYPGQYIIRTPKTQIAEKDYIEFQICNSLCYHSFTLPIDKWPSEGMQNQAIEERDIFIDFDPGDMFISSPNNVDISPANSIQCPELQGMSGGGIWLLESKDVPIWEPSVKLIGIQHSVKKDEWIHGTLIKCWLDLAL